MGAVARCPPCGLPSPCRTLWARFGWEFQVSIWSDCKPCGLRYRGYHVEQHHGTGTARRFEPRKLRIRLSFELSWEKHHPWGVACTARAGRADCPSVSCAFHLSGASQRKREDAAVRQTHLGDGCSCPAAVPARIATFRGSQWGWGAVGKESILRSIGLGLGGAQLLPVLP